MQYIANIIESVVWGVVIIVMVLAICTDIFNRRD